MKTHRIPFKNTRLGLVSNSYENQTERSLLYCFNPPTYSKIELQNYAFSSDVFESIYIDWFRSGFKYNLRPVFDRIDNKKGYSFDNLQVITSSENSAKGVTERHSKIRVVKINDYGLEIESFKSFVQASYETGISKDSIKLCCRNKRSHAGGFNWKRVNI